MGRTGCCSDRGVSDPERPVPSALVIVWLILRLWSRYLWLKMRLLFIDEKWVVLTRKESEPARSWQGFRRLRAPRGSFWADPFLIAVDGQRYLLMEEFSVAEGKAHIVLGITDDQGRIRSHVPVLKRPYHLSYPFIFQWQGGFYMIPETGGHGTIELYASSPDLMSWSFVMNLMQGIEARDTTLYFDGQRWWLMTCMAENRGCNLFDELFLFSAKEFKTTAWTPHPANPVVSDVRHARPAGALLHLDGKLYRPAQDCSRRYGSNLMLCEIAKLDEREYSETPRPFVEGPRPKKMVAAHTLNHTSGLTVVDVIQTRCKITQKLQEFRQDRVHARP